jgi:hypothetical protein
MEKYVINPAYILRSDGNKAILCAKPFLIHPFNAQMLSFFNGEDDLETCIRNISIYFNFTLNDTKEIVSPYIENDEAYIQ